MLNIIENTIENVHDIFNGTFYKWDDLSLNNSIPDRELTLHSANPLTVTVSGNAEMVCSACNNDGSLLNFSFINEKILLSPTTDAVTLTFNRPVFAAGVKIGVTDGSKSTRPFRAKIVAIDSNDKKINVPPIDALSTNNINKPPALFLGAISKNQQEGIKSLTFSVDSIFSHFAIGSLFYMQNQFR